MCGIIGYTGSLEAEPVLLAGLEQLEYRGYDSAGIALSGENGIAVIKRTGPVENLKHAEETAPFISRCGIGHTRWATHGGVTDQNAHPHRAGKTVLVHNGIIENYHKLIADFEMEKDMVSETDSEVAARLIDRFYEGDPVRAIYRGVSYLTGSYAFCILFADLPGKLFCIRKISPLVAAESERGMLVSSDVTALLPYTDHCFVVPENVLLELSETEIRLLPENGAVQMPERLALNWNAESAQKGGYPFFMLKEIYEQPEAILRTLRPRIKNGLPDFTEERIPDGLFRQINRIYIVACGTAMYAGMVGKALMEPLLRLPVSVEIASEFRYAEPLLDEKTLTVVISQSGETIDTLSALRLARSHASPVLSIVNVKGSTIARESDYVLYTYAGPEIAVASTKAYSVQLASLYLLACKIGLIRGTVQEEAARVFLAGLSEAVSAMEDVLEKESEIERIAAVLREASDAYYIGRGLDYAFSLEGALKIKEVSYIHAEAYPAGELKHGTIALIEPGTPVVAIVTQEKLSEKTVSNIREVKARGACVILIEKEGSEIPPEVYDFRVTLPVRQDLFAGLPAAVVLQLLAYHTAVKKGLNVDKPRNLAKSVTVE